MSNCRRMAIARTAFAASVDPKRSILTFCSARTAQPYGPFSTMGPVFAPSATCTVRNLRGGGSENRIRAENAREPMNPETEDAARSQEAEQDPRAEAAKYAAWRRANMRARKQAALATMIIAIPIGWMAWSWNAHLAVLSLLDISSTTSNQATWIRLGISALAWEMAVIALFPVRSYLRMRWKVNPERYGLSEGGQQDG